jgi:2-polyprenyl-3-methyl-5-hydroxy-6-metoxy-1,4-benzoquinol methylase
MKVNYIDMNRAMWEVTADIYQINHFQRDLIRVQQPDFSNFDEVEKAVFNKHISIQGKSTLQVGCNNGIELICLKKLGAAECVGIDVSSKFIEHAKALAKSAGYDIAFECADVYAINYRYFNRFDLVYITVGVLGWLPDLTALFKIIQKVLKPGGQLFIYEQHPLLNMFNPEPPHAMDASYFKTEPFKDNTLPEYIDVNREFKATSYWFQHTTADIIQACVSSGLLLTHFNEYARDVSDTYKTLETSNAQLPLSFTLIALKAPLYKNVN